MQDHLQQSKTLFLMHKIKSYKLKPQLSNNIFEEHNPYYGPQYDTVYMIISVYLTYLDNNKCINNKIVARSVVGKPDVIEKIKRKIEESKLSNSPKMKNSAMYQKMKQSYSNLSNMKKSQSSNKIPLFHDPIHSNVLSRQVSHNKSTMATLVNHHANVNVEQYLQETKNRIQRNEMEELQLEKYGYDNIGTVGSKPIKLLQICAVDTKCKYKIIKSYHFIPRTRVILGISQHDYPKQVLSKKQRQTHSIAEEFSSTAYRLKKQLLNELPSPPKNWYKKIKLLFQLYQQLRGSSYMVEKEEDQSNNSMRVTLNSKTLLLKQADLESSLKVRGESKLKKEFEKPKCSLITMVGQDKVEESEILPKLKY